MDLINAIYFDDANNTWLVRNRGIHLLALGFLQYDPAVHIGVYDLPSGFEMRKVNMVAKSTDGDVKYASFPCGNITSGVYTGEDTLTYKGPGLDASGAAGDVEIVYSTSSTSGEVRPFITTVDPGATEFMLQDNVTAVTPVTP